MEEYYFLIKIDNLYGYINEKGKIVIEPKYEQANDFSEGLAFVKTCDGIQQYIDMQDNVAFAFKTLGQGLAFKNGLAKVNDGQPNKGFFDTQGNIIFVPMFEYLYSDFNEYNLAAVKVNDKIGLINRDGEYVIEPIYDSIAPISEGLIGVKSNGKAGYIDIEGNVVIDFIFDQVYTFHDGLACFMVEDKNGFNHKYGVINKIGEIVIKPEFRWIYSFSCGLAPAIKEIKKNKSNNTGFIDKNGNFAIKDKYYRAGPFIDGIASVEEKNTQGYINLKGKNIVKPVFSTTSDFKNGLGRITYKAEWGYINKEGEFVYRPKGFDLW